MSVGLTHAHATPFVVSADEIVSHACSNPPGEVMTVIECVVSRRLGHSTCCLCGLPWQARGSGPRGLLVAAVTRFTKTKKLRVCYAHDTRF